MHRINWIMLSLRQDRTNLACFTSDKVRKHNVCPQGAWETWRRLRHLIKETAGCYFIGEHWRAGRYVIFYFKAIIDGYW